MCRRVNFLIALLGFVVVVAARSQRSLKIPKTSFSCQGRTTGYYADVETGCQIYHMCDGLGRQFSYACPNTTLFQQRMLICDHWYMVNCSHSERDYSANLLIGQRDKPFVSDDEVHVRTPRPDILSAPYSPEYNYYGKAEVTSASDSIANNEIGDPERPQEVFAELPTRWSTEQQQTTSDPLLIREATSSFTGRPIIVEPPSPSGPETIANPEAPSGPQTIIGPSGGDIIVNVPIEPPSKLFEPPLLAPADDFRRPSGGGSTTVRSISDFNDQLLNDVGSFGGGASESQEDGSAKDSKETGEQFVDFINRFNPSAKADGFDGLRQQGFEEVERPAQDLVPPKTEFTEFASTTMGPPIYYEWKWAAPAFDLEPPSYSENRVEQEAASSGGSSSSSRDGRPDFALPRPSTTTTTTTTTTTPRPVTARSIRDPSEPEYKLASYFVPNYVFPLDRQHPGYDEAGSRTSFQVARAVRADGSGGSGSAHPNYGENAACPQCHPSFVVPGTCKPCVTIRRR